MPCRQQMDVFVGVVDMTGSFRDSTLVRSVVGSEATSFRFINLISHSD